jgi:tetratricopeptide (TPR) repeat protein
MPHFNAAMAPNGFMQIWSGLLLRAQNEDQLAYVLGHEIGHFNRRHSLQQWRTVRNTASGLVVFQLLTAGAGLGWAGDIAQLAALAGIFAYSRDQEREADDIGLDLMAAAGYDPREAPVIWRNLIEEQEASGDKDPVFFFASHPSSAERLETLEARAAEMAGRMEQTSRREEYADLIGPFRGRWIHDELQKRDFAATQVVLAHLFAGDRNPGELYFYQGELYRMRGDGGDPEKAIAAYETALQNEGHPHETYRSLGLLLWKSANTQGARDAFEKYLEVWPDAPDAPMIKAYLKELVENGN